MITGRTLDDAVRGLEEWTVIHRIVKTIMKYKERAERVRNRRENSLKWLSSRFILYVEQSGQILLFNV